MPSIDTDHASIYYECHGEAGAPAVLFAHGAGGNAMSWWQQVPAFSAHHRVITIDHRSFGRSTCEPGHFAPAHFRADALAVLDAEGVDRAAFVCQSMGGWTGLPAALRNPDRVSCLVLCDTPGGLFTETIAGALAATGERIRGAGIQAGAALAPDFPQREPELAHLYAQISGLNVNVEPTALGTLYAPEARIAPEALEGYDRPTLVLAGEHDLLFPLEVMRHVAELIPGASLREFPACGHSVYFEDPVSFNRHVEEFVSKFAAR